MSKNAAANDLWERRRAARAQVREIYAAERKKLGAIVGKDGKKQGVTVAPRSRSVVAKIDALSAEIAELSIQIEEGRVSG